MCSAHVEPLPSLSISKDSVAFEVADHATRQIQGASHDDHDHDHDHSTSAEDEESHAHKHDGGHDDNHQEHVSAGEAERTIVTTPEQLLEAVQRGDEHIEVQKHLDLTGLAMQNCGGGVNCILGAVPATVKTIRGDCNEDPTVWPPEGTAVLREFLPQQCMLLADVDLLKVVDSNLWVDQLYIRFKRSDRQPATVTALAKGQFFHFLEVQGDNAQVWITSTTLQGDGTAETDCFFCGLAVWNNADVFVGGCTFADFVGDHAAGVSDGATLSFVDTYFRHNHLTPLYTEDDESHLSVVIADVGFSGLGSTAIRLEKCIFDRNTPVTAPTLLAASPNATQKALFYSDASSPKVCDVKSESWALEAEEQANAAAVTCAYSNARTLDSAQNDDPGAFFLTTKNEWFESMMKVTGSESLPHASSDISFNMLPDAEVEAIARKSSIKPGALAGLMILTAVVGAALVGGAWLYMAKFRSTEAPNSQYHTSDGECSQVYGSASKHGGNSAAIHDVS